MKIIHCCLAAFYIDDAGYQENILPRMHKLQGHDVRILASTETYVNNKSIGYVAAGSYTNQDEIPVTRVCYSRFLPQVIVKKLRLYRGIYAELERFRPDIIFLHDCQFLSIRAVVKYVHQYPEAKVFVDGHTDLINSARGWISRNILHGLVYRWCAQAIEPHAIKFYGVLPARVEFFQSVYGIPATKTELLVLGADDSKINWKEETEIRRRIRDQLGVGDSDLLLVTGGKLDRRKNIHTLLRAVAQMDHSRLKVLVFGTPSDDMEREFADLFSRDFVRYIGWVDANSVYDYFFASDLGVFPGTHSVLWEQAVGTGLPCIFHRWPGMQHIDLEGNCRFFENGSESEICEVLRDALADRVGLARMREIALSRGVPYFAYSDIARRAIESH